ncbi:amino acid permease [bacterium]|nr:amino acid permease [bacterium]
MTSKKIELKRSISLPILTLFGLGNVLGAGIYVLIGKVAGEAGTAAPLSFIIAAGIAGLTALSYMELSHRFPVSAGASAYVHEGLKLKPLAQFVGLLILLSAIFSSATLAIGFAGYMQSFVDISTPILVILLFLGLGAITAYGIAESSKTAAIITILEIVGLAMIIWAGRDILVSLDTYQSVQTSRVSITAILGGAFLAFYAFIGFEDIVNVAEESKAPAKIMPLAIIIALIAATVLYILVVIVATHSIPIESLAASQTPLADIFTGITKTPGTLISTIGILSAINGVLVHLVLVSRLLYGMAQRGLIHAHFGAVHRKTRTPILATIISVIVMTAAALSLPIVSLASLTSYVVLILFCLVNLSLIVIKFRPAARQPKLSIPIIIPILGLILSALMVFVG